MIPVLAWRNVWRNKVRSMVVIFAIALGLFGTIFVAAMSRGMVNRMVQNTIENEIADLLIIDSAYLVSEELQDVVETGPLREALQGAGEQIESFSFRVKTEAMANSANSSSQVLLWGVLPEEERCVSAISEQVEEGVYFGSDTRFREVVASRELADELELGLGSKVVMSFADVDGNIVYQNFKIVGLFKTGNTEFDKYNAYVDRNQLVRDLKLSAGSAHEAAVRAPEENLPQLVRSISTEFPAYLVRKWNQVNPNLEAIGTLTDISTFIMLLIVLIALIFGVINTMLMVVMERRKELGMLRALGLTNLKVSAMIVLETVFLSIVGGLLGNLFSFVSIRWFGKRGIKWESAAAGLESMGVGDTMYPELSAGSYLVITGLVLLTALIAAVFPVRRALRQDIAETLRN